MYLPSLRLPPLTHQKVVPPPGGATCGECKDGLIDNAATGVCEPRVSCEELSCADESRECLEEPNGHCGGCLEGFVEDAGENAVFGSICDGDLAAALQQALDTFGAACERFPELF